MGAVAKLARIGLVVGAVALGALAGAMPAQAAANWPVTVSCTGDVILPGQVGDTYTFTFAAAPSACRPGAGQFVYVYNRLTVGGNTDGSGFLSAPSPSSFLYNTANSGLLGWYSTGVQSSAPYALQVMTVTLLPTNLAGQSLGGAGSRVGAIQEPTMGAYFDIYWGTASSSGGGSAAAPDPTFTLTSNSTDRGTCWPTVGGVGGVWVQLTDTGCAPPSGRGNATLLGWATSPAFPVNRAQNQVAVDEDFNGVRMIFIPLNGYTVLSGDNTMYPIWST